MKFFAIILSFYILFLTAIPCVDKPLDNVLHKVELVQNTGDTHHDDSDHCSPFCTCDCCISPIVYNETIIQFKIFSFAEESLFNYLFNYNSEPSCSIWQPPKLS